MCQAVTKKNICTRALTVMHVAVSLGGVELDGLQEVALGLGLLPLR